MKKYAPNKVLYLRQLCWLVGITEDGHRAILSVEIGDSENESSWDDVFKGLKNRGLRGIIFAVSDDHTGLVNALHRNFQGVAWQRCQVHFIRNFIMKLSRRDLKLYLPLLKDIFTAADEKEALRRKRAPGIEAGRKISQGRRLGR